MCWRFKNNWVTLFHLFRQTESFWDRLGSAKYHHRQDVSKIVFCSCSTICLCLFRSDHRWLVELLRANTNWEQFSMLSSLKFSIKFNLNFKYEFFNYVQIDLWGRQFGARTFVLSARLRLWEGTTSLCGALLFVSGDEIELNWILCCSPEEILWFFVNFVHFVKVGVKRALNPEKTNF